MGLRGVLAVGCVAAAVSFGAGSSASAMSLREAVTEALTSNPEILQAAENREAVEFELRQARSLYLPTLDLEGSVGIRGSTARAGERSARPAGISIRTMSA